MFPAESSALLAFYGCRRLCYQDTPIFPQHLSGPSCCALGNERQNGGSGACAAGATHLPVVYVAVFLPTASTVKQWLAMKRRAAVACSVFGGTWRGNAYHINSTNGSLKHALLPLARSHPLVTPSALRTRRLCWVAAAVVVAYGLRTASGSSSSDSGTDAWSLVALVASVVTDVDVRGGGDWLNNYVGDFCPTDFVSASSVGARARKSLGEFCGQRVSFLRHRVSMTLHFVLVNETRSQPLYLCHR